MRTTGKISDSGAVQPDSHRQSQMDTSSKSPISASAEDSYEEPRTSPRRLNGVAAVTLVIAKQSGENTVATADASF